MGNQAAAEFTPTTAPAAATTDEEDEQAQIAGLLAALARTPPLNTDFWTVRVLLAKVYDFLPLREVCGARLVEA
eukprot:gene17732-51415_t